MLEPQSTLSGESADYPYGALPLAPQWSDRGAQVLTSLIATCATISMVLNWDLWPVHRLALMIILPALLGVTLAFAPDPPSAVSRLAKRLTTAGCAIGTLMGPWLAPAILAVPALLALSVGIGAVSESKRA